jgi:hypothetical protein
VKIISSGIITLRGECVKSLATERGREEKRHSRDNVPLGEYSSKVEIITHGTVTLSGKGVKSKINLVTGREREELETIQGLCSLKRVFQQSYNSRDILSLSGG